MLPSFPSWHLVTYVLSWYLSSPPLLCRLHKAWDLLCTWLWPQSQDTQNEDNVAVSLVHLFQPNLMCCLVSTKIYWFLLWTRKDREGVHHSPKCSLTYLLIYFSNPVPGREADGLCGKTIDWIINRVSVLWLCLKDQFRAKCLNLDSSLLGVGGKLSCTL